MNTTTPVAVFQLVPDSYTHSGLALVRTLGRLGVPVYAVYGEHRAPAASSRHAHATLVWNDWDNPEAIIGHLLELGEEIGQRAILIPYDDASALLVDDNGGLLREHFIFPERPPSLARSLADKRAMSALCHTLGIPTARTESTGSDDEFYSFIEQASFPLVLKGARSWIPGLPSRTTIMVAQTPTEALSAYRDMGAAERSNLMLQEYIPGGPDSVWMFNGYFDEHSECLVAFTGKKIRQSPPYTGATSLGVCIWNASVAETTTEFMKAIGYRGILDIGYRFDARDGQYKLLDVNPRVGSTFRLFVDPTNGMDVVRALYLDLTGQTVPRAQQREGRKWVVEPWDTRSSIEYRKDGRLTVRDWLRSFRNVEEAAWFAVDDPVPSIMMSARLSAKALRKSVRRVGEAIRGRHPA